MFRRLPDTRQQSYPTKLPHSSITTSSYSANCSHLFQPFRIILQRGNTVPMQLSNADRRTVTVRVPKKFQFLVKAFVCFLKIHDDAALLWNAETILQNYYEDNDDDKSKENIKKKGEIMTKVLGRIVR